MPGPKQPTNPFGVPQPGRRSDPPQRRGPFATDTQRIEAGRAARDAERLAKAGRARSRHDGDAMEPVRRPDPAPEQRQPGDDFGDATPTPIMDPELTPPPIDMFELMPPWAKQFGQQLWQHVDNVNDRARKRSGTQPPSKTRFRAIFALVFFFGSAIVGLGIKAVDVIYERGRREERIEQQQREQDAEQKRNKARIEEMEQTLRMLKETR